MSDFCEHGAVRPVSTASLYRIENNDHPNPADRLRSAADIYGRSSDVSRRTMQCGMACLDLLPGGDDLRFSTAAMHGHQRLYLSRTRAGDYRGESHKSG